MKTRNKAIIFFVTLCLITLMAAPAPVLAAEPTVNLGDTITRFAVLAGTTITNTGPTTIGGSVGGNIGVSPGTAVTGFPPGILTESDAEIHATDATALQAQAELVTAYDDAAGRTPTMDLTDQDLGDMTLTTGVYSFDSSAQLTGTLTLDAQGDPEAVFIFQIVSTLITAPDSVVSLINGARFCRVFWQVGSSATLGTNTDFVGHIFALTSIAAQTGATVQGQLLARNGAVTLDSNTITNGVCETATPTPTNGAATPTPTTGASSPTPTNGATPTPTNSAATPTPTNGASSPTPTTGPDDEIPQTGETGNYGFIGLILLGLAVSLAVISRRRQAR